VKLSPLEQRLVKEFEKFEVVDAHEHLPPEQVRTSAKVDVFTLFSHYTRTDIITAGMKPQDYDRLLNPDLPLDMRWNMFEPYLEQIRFGSYARPAFIAAKEFYGQDDISRKTYAAITEAMQAFNKPGIYSKVLREKCRIRTALTQGNRTDYDLDLLVPLMPLDTYAGVFTWEDIAHRARDLGLTVNTLDDYVSAMEQGVARWKEQGTVGLKMASRPYSTPDRPQALCAFERLRSGAEARLADMNPLRDFLTEKLLQICARQELMVAVHAGVWGDFRELDSGHIIPIVMRNPNTRFDLYHAGMPAVRQTGMIGKNFPNVWLNLCWCHIVSPVMTRSALNEWVDLVPVNKIIAFGGDYGLPVEKVYGHLVMARENIARVLARRIEDDLMTEDQAVGVAEKWFFDNPKQAYRLRI
jgi:predicted TIM-barrel fold metal-dependent hydrolase